MALPPPPSAAPAAPTTTSNSATAVADAPKAKIEPKKFGKGKGPDAIPVPTINGTDLLAVQKQLVAALGGIDLVGLCTAIDATPTTSYPGNKEGRSAYRVGMVIKSIAKINEYLNKARVAAGERKPRVKKTDKYLTMLTAAIKVNPAMKDAIKAQLGDQLKELGIDIDSL